MFVAKFQQVNSTKFSQDKNDEFPFIGEVIAGKATGTIINGTMFKREGLEPNKAYLCQNITEEYEGKDQVRTSVISAVSLLELKPLMEQLGTASLDVDTNSPE